MHTVSDRRRASRTRCFWRVLGLLVATLPKTLSAAFIEMPEAVRPGAVRPGGEPMGALAEFYKPAPLPFADRPPPRPSRPGAIRPGQGDAFKVDEFSLAQVADLPDAARPGAIRPGEDRKIIPEPPPEKLFEVPPVVERPLDIDDGEKIVVTGFVIEGASDRPEFEITAADVNSIADAKLSERPDGFTVGRLQEVADQITKYYREHGLILAQAFIPVQAVESGVVKIQIMEGVLGRVVAEGNEMYKEETLQTPFRSLVGQPVTKEAIESALLTVSDYPGQSSFGVFQPGVQVGTADMVIKVQEEKRFGVSFRGDNHGITETGQNRYLAAFDFNNITGQGDQFRGVVQHTAVPGNTFFYAMDYEVPVTGFFDTNFAIGLNRNQFQVAGAFRDAEITSDIRNYTAVLSKDFIRSRLKNLTAGLRITKKRSGTKSRGRRVNLDSLAVASFEMNFDNVDTRFAGLNAGFLEISQGFNNLFGAMNEDVAQIRPTRQGGTGEFAQGKFTSVFMSLSRFQALSPLWDKLANHNILWTFEIFYSADLLVPLEQYSIGGPTNVRGYRPTEALFDRAVFGSVEWIINAPFISDVSAFGNRT